MDAVNKYTPGEILQIFQADYLQQQQVDPEAELGEDLTFDTTIEEWMSICDLFPPKQLAEYYNSRFEINLPIEEWLLVLEPPQNKSLKQLAEFIARRANRPRINPIKLLGRECQSAATFKHLLRKFEIGGIDTKQIRPSTKLEPFAKKHLGIVVEEVNKINPRALPAVEYKSNVIFRISMNLFLLVVLLLIASIWLSNLSTIIVSLFLFGILLSLISSKLTPAKTYFSGIDTFGDLVKAIENEKNG